jgi:hypothetical protein
MKYILVLIVLLLPPLFAAAGQQDLLIDDFENGLCPASVASRCPA